ncbi:HAD family hydrolase [Mobilitalea sibirica]|uniref:HAD family hydrolase n=2 Tax=Mobilitalea sibirica TaxID=1462919 RepID=A0A8J7H120_9FIRM|nr:HAD family hydrolase [Mobilitalea sibirica]
MEFNKSNLMKIYFYFFILYMVVNIVNEYSISEVMGVHALIVSGIWMVVSIILYFAVIRHEVFRKILGTSYNETYAEECWEDANIILAKCLKEYVTRSNIFYSVKEIFEKCYQELFPRKGIKLDPQKGAGILAYEHGYSVSYPDTEGFFNAVNPFYPVCLVSDADYDMVSPLFDRFHFDKVFVSEGYQCYKHSCKGSLFHNVLTNYKVNPNQIIHIGDSYADIAGAKRFGIKTCWLNRDKRVWPYDIKPDYTVSSLIEAAQIIGIDVENIV